MAGITQSNLRRGLAALVLGAAIAVGAGMVTGPLHAGAVGVPTKTCVGPSSGAAQPGKADVCTVSILGILANGDQYVVQPAAPAGAVISACAGTTVTTPFAYTTTAAVTSNACTWTVSGVTAAAAGNLVLGTETLQISPATKSGTSVTQTATQCSIFPPPPLPGGALTCGPSTPMGTSGTGSCVGGADIPIVGGCQPANPLTTPTPTPTASSSGGGTTTTDNGNGTTSGGVQAASTKSTPFTSGPPHPLPVAATLVAVGGGVLALVGLGAPKLLRRRRGR
jgi:hypothetical protein